MSDPLVPPTLPPFDSGSGDRQSPSPEELSVLLNALVDETITAEQMARLDSLLVHDEECRRAYREVIGLHVALQFSFQGTDDQHGRLDPSAAKIAFLSPGNAIPARTRWFAPYALITATAAAVLVAAVFAWHAGWFGAGTPIKSRIAGSDDHQPPAASAAVAVLQCGDSCRWAKESLAFAAGGALAVGQTLDLLEGTATLHYESGISLVLDGPAQLTLVSPTHARLDRGKCFTSVPLPNKGFRISTPFAEVIDKGTEFGVNVSEKGYSEVGVFKGEVECFAMDRSGSPIDRVQLLAGQAVRLDERAAQPVASLDAIKSSFPAPASSPAGVRCYWRFEEEPPAPVDDGLSTQRNAISDSSGNGCRLDFWPGGKAGVGRYRFSNDVPPARMFRDGFGGGRHSFDCGALSPDAAGIAISGENHGSPEAIANGFTIEGFFKTHGDLSAGKPMTMIYQGEKFYSYLVGLNKSGPGTFTFFTYGQLKGKTHMPALVLKDKNFTDGKWHYFAARYEVDPQTRGSRLRADVTDEDGRRFSGILGTPDGFKIAYSSRPLLIGRQQYFANEKPKAHFNGLIDEIRIANRPLRDEELLVRFPPEQEPLASVIK